MNLRTFHLLFITVATLLSVFLAVWTIDRYLTSGSIEYALIAIVSIAAVAALIAYAVAFRRTSQYW